MAPKCSATECWGCLDTKFVQIFEEEPDNLKNIQTVLFIRNNDFELSNSELFNPCVS